jgi:hypothetical protein
MCEWKEKKCWHLKFSSMSYVSNCGDQWHINLNLNNCIFFLLFRECWLEIWQWRSKLQTLWQRQFDFDDRVPTGPRLLLVRTGSFLQLSLYNHISLGWKKNHDTDEYFFSSDTQARCSVWRSNAVLPKVKYFPPYYVPSFAEPFERKVKELAVCERKENRRDAHNFLPCLA